MFTGIVTDVGSLIAVEPRNDIIRLRIACGYEPDGIDLGASIAIAGVCLTAVAVEPQPDGGAIFDVQAAPEAQKLTTVGRYRVGDRVNLERPLKVGDELGGHMVSGHVDGRAKIIGREDYGDTVRFEFEAPSELARFIAPKGSIALDGTSLTVNKVTGNTFDCLLIPHTLSVTTWGDRNIGDTVNLEVDTIARYVARLRDA